MKQSKNLSFLVSVLVSGLALTLPQVSQAQSSPLAIGQNNAQWQQGTDRIRSADGIECSVSTAPRDKWMEVGAVGGKIGGQGSDYSYAQGYNTNNGSTGPGNIVFAPQNDYNRTAGGAWAKLVINLDKETPRIDCNRLYDLEIDRLKGELEQAKMGMTTVKASPK